MSFSKLMGRVLLSCLFLWSISIANNIVSKDIKAAEQVQNDDTINAGPMSLNGESDINQNPRFDTNGPAFKNKENESAVRGFSSGSQKNPDEVISNFYDTDNTESKNLDVLPYQKGTNTENDAEKPAFRSGTIVDSNNANSNNTNSNLPVGIEGTEVQREGSVIEGTVNPINLNTDKPAFRLSLIHI